MQTMSDAGRRLWSASASWDHADLAAAAKVVVAELDAAHENSNYVYEQGAPWTAVRIGRRRGDDDTQEHPMLASPFLEAATSLEQKFWSPKKNSRKLTLGPEKERRIETLLKSSVNSQAEQDVLRNKIMEIFDEAEENEKELNEKKNKTKRRHNSDPEKDYRNQKHKDDNDKKHRVRSRSRSRERSKSRNKLQTRESRSSVISMGS